MDQPDDPTVRSVGTSAAQERVGRRWRTGADEARLARHLARLRCPPWHIVHSLALRRSEDRVDHVVIGPPGVFVVGTSNDVLADAKAVADLIEGCPVRPAVTPVVAVYPKELTMESQFSGVEVRDGRYLRRWLTRLPKSLTPAEGVTVLQHLTARRTSP